MSPYLYIYIDPHIYFCIYASTEHPSTSPDGVASLISDKKCRLT